jgi:hypothetical protein
LEQDVARKFGSKYPMPPSVKAADMEVVVWEAENLFKPVPEWVLKYKEEHPYVLIDKLKTIPFDETPDGASGFDRAFYPFNCWQPYFAKAKFLRRFMDLVSEKKDVTQENQ